MPGRFDRVWSEDLERAITSAVLDRGMSCPKAVRAALDGQLEVPAPKLEGSTPADLERRLIASARRWAARERAQRRGDETPGWAEGLPTGGVIEKSLERAAAIAASEVDTIQRQRKGKRDLDRLRKAVQVLRETDALERKAAPTRSSAMRGDKDQSNGPETGETNAAALIRLAKETGAGEMPRQDDRAKGNRDGDGDAHTDTDDRRTDTGPETETEGRGILRDADAERAGAAAELGIDLGD
jgi:hypothetical protein